MSIGRTVLLTTLLACREPPPPAAPPVALPTPEPIASPPVAPALPPPPPLPSSLVASLDAGTPHDVDASTFKRPTGVYALVHDSLGDTQTNVLTKAASCAKADAYVRVEVATGRILHSEGPASVIDCIAAYLKRDASWKQGYEITAVEIVVTK